MRLPKFTATETLYTSGGRYRQSQFARTPGNVVVPAIPFCDNCDYILDRCDRTGGRPRALCRACAIGNCFSGVEDPTPDDPWSPLPGQW